jgi:hypothetical protein
MRAIIYLTISCLIFALFSCSDELETSPLTSLDNTTIWSSESNALLALMGCYRGNIGYNSTGFEPTGIRTVDRFSWNLHPIMPSIAGQQQPGILHYINCPTEPW